MNFQSTSPQQNSTTHLKYIREISEVEDIVEFDGSGQESGGHFLVELKSHIHNLLRVLLDL